MFLFIFCSHHLAIHLNYNRQCARDFNPAAKVTRKLNLEPKKTSASGSSRIADFTASRNIAKPGRSHRPWHIAIF